MSISPIGAVPPDRLMSFWSDEHRPCEMNRSLEHNRTLHSNLRAARCDQGKYYHKLQVD